MTTSAEVAIRNLAPGNMSYTSKRRKLPPASALEVAVRLTLNTNRGLFEEGDFLNYLDGRFNMLRERHFARG